MEGVVGISVEMGGFVVGKRRPRRWLVGDLDGGDRPARRGGLGECLAERREEGE